MLKRMIFLFVFLLVSGAVLCQDKTAIFANESAAWLSVDEGFKTSFDIKLSESEKLEFEEKLNPLKADVNSQTLKIGKDTYRINLVFQPQTHRTYPIKIFTFLGINTCEVGGKRTTLDEMFIK
jgi:hypothetical protein